MSDALMRRLALVLSLGLMAGSLGACNTVEGFGDDVEAAGDEIEEATD
jgi:predicted small secreted protein